MLADNAATYSAFVAAYARRDLERAIEFFADDIVLALHVDRDTVPFGGVTIGRAQVMRRWQMIASAFDMPLYRLEHVVVEREPDQLHARVAYRFRHIATGEEIEGHMRHVFWMRDGQIARGNEYHDRARVEAFFRLIGALPPTA